ncbi:MAG: SPOR domain-containing protein [Candidatus Omnitrophica bacterium]|nr:SPOR domain-containing protein [Candidatus Omnitrophota bacterium]
MNSKSVWLVIVLVAAGAVIFVLSFKQKEEPWQAPPKAGQAVIAAVPVKATAPAGGHAAGYAVQVYSFQDKTRAEKALEALRSKGYQAFLVVSDLGEKGTWYRVRVGGIADEKEAQVMLENVRKNYKSGFIVKPKV